MRENNVCRLCLKVPRNEFMLIDETSQQGLDVLSVKMNFDVSNDSLMCENCAENLKNSLAFISVCLESEKAILLFGEDGIDIDLRDVYTNKAQEVVLRDFYVCRFCITKVEERHFTLLDVLMKDNTISDMLRRYMFQMDLNITKNPIICFHCRDNMESYIKFLLTCCNTEEKINTYRRNAGIGIGKKIMLNNVFERFFNYTYISKDRSNLECDARSNGAPPFTEDINLGSVSSEMTEVMRIKSEELDIKCEETFTVPTVHKCKLCPYQGAWIKSHMLRHQDVSEITMYKCTSCDFQTKYRNSLKNHSLTHKIEADVTMYKCMDCDYETKYKSYLKDHSLVHKTKAEVKVYNCTTCDFKTKYRRSIKVHMRTHKAKTDLRQKTYKCTVCNFNMKRKKYLKNHLLTHKAEAEVTMYKCTTCDFKTKHKKSLRSHSLVHKTEAEVTMYKCTSCDYRTKYKKSLKSHSLMHKTEAEVTMYKCTSCDYKTKYKRNIKSHSKVHNEETNLEMYKCTACDYQTTHSTNVLKRHLLTHKFEIEVAMYKCMACDFKTKHQQSLKRHFLGHKTDAEVTMYKCMTCDYKTKHKRNLKKHLLTHKTETEVRMFKCAACHFKTKHKHSLKRHSLIHMKDRGRSNDVNNLKSHSE